MYNSFWNKVLVLGILVLFIGFGTFSSTGRTTIDKNFVEEIISPLKNDNVNIKVQIPDEVETRYRLIQLFVYLNGSGETEKELDVFDDEWRIILKFKFFNEEAEMQIGFFGLPLWKIFPNIFNLQGPYEFQTILFYGNINKIDNNYHIEGYCFNLAWRK